MITNINEYKEKEIRVSCASLASIIIDDKYLLCLNKTKFEKGLLVYTPFGGAIEFIDRQFLDLLHVTYEKGNDIRLYMQESRYTEFLKWFRSKKDREFGIERELIEEMVDEEHIFDGLSSSDFNSTFVKEEQQFADNSHRTYEIFNVEFVHSKVSEILEKLKDENTHMYLATKEEILSGVTKDGIKIGENTIATLW